MRCRACDTTLSDNELMPRKVRVFTEDRWVILSRYEDMCNRCWYTEKYDHDSYSQRGDPLDEFFK